MTIIKIKIILKGTPSDQWKCINMLPTKYATTPKNFLFVNILFCSLILKIYLRIKTDPIQLPYLKTAIGKNIPPNKGNVR